MKRLLFPFLIAASAAHAQLLVSNFSGFTPDYYSQPFPADATSWSPLTAQSGATAFTLGDFGQGSPGGTIGNGFIEFLASPADWSAYTTVTLRGFTAASNATPSLAFYVEDENASAAVSVFALSAFGTNLFMDVTIPLSFAGIDPAHIGAWGFVVQEANNPVFGFTFDNLTLNLPGSPGAVPEPSTYGLVGTFVLLSVVGFRRLRRNC